MEPIRDDSYAWQSFPEIIEAALPNTASSTQRKSGEGPSEQKRKELKRINTLLIRELNYLVEHLLLQELSILPPKSSNQHSISLEELSDLLLSYTQAEPGSIRFRRLRRSLNSCILSFLTPGLSDLKFQRTVALHPSAGLPQSEALSILEKILSRKCAPKQKKSSPVRFGNLFGFKPSPDVQPVVRVLRRKNGVWGAVDMPADRTSAKLYKQLLRRGRGLLLTEGNLLQCFDYREKRLLGTPFQQSKLPLFLRRGNLQHQECCARL